MVLARSPVDPEHLALRAAAGEAEVRLRTGVVGHEHRRTGHLDQVHRAAVAERHALDGTRLDELADFGRPGSEQWGLPPHGDGVGELTERELDIERHGRARRQRQTLPPVSLESGQLGLDHVWSDRQRAQRVEALSVGRGSMALAV